MNTGSVQKYPSGEQDHIPAQIHIQCSPLGRHAGDGSSAASPTLLIGIYGFLSKGTAFYSLDRK